MYRYTFVVNGDGHHSIGKWDLTEELVILALVDPGVGDDAKSQMIASTLVAYRPQHLWPGKPRFQSQSHQNTQPIAPNRNPNPPQRVDLRKKVKFRNGLMVKLFMAILPKFLPCLLLGSAIRFPTITAWFISHSIGRKGCLPLTYTSQELYTSTLEDIQATITVDLLRYDINEIAKVYKRAEYYSNTYYWLFLGDLWPGCVISWTHDDEILSLSD